MAQVINSLEQLRGAKWSLFVSYVAVDYRSFVVSYFLCSGMVRERSRLQVRGHSAHAKVLSSDKRGELVVKLFPKFVMGVLIFAGSTGVFGILHLVASSIEEPPHFSLIFPSIVIGASIAVVVFLLALFVVYPSIKAMSRILLEMQAKNEQQPPPEFAKLQKRVAMVANVAVILLPVVLAFMVWSGEL